jgi:hypothetical protein
VSDSEVQSLLKSYDPADVQSVARTVAALKRLGKDHAVLEPPTCLENGEDLGAGIARWSIGGVEVWTFMGIRGWVLQDLVLQAARSTDDEGEWEIIDRAWKHCDEVDVDKVNLRVYLRAFDLNEPSFLRLVESMRKHGLRLPIDVDRNLRVLDGWQRVMAARKLRWHKIKTRLWCSRQLSY